MYMKYEISFSWMLASAGFDFPKVHERTVKRNEQGSFFQHSFIITILVCSTVFVH